jgi:hypothetical protein
MIGMARPFASWEAHSKAFNSSYLNMSNGEFVIAEINFVGMVVDREKTFIHAIITNHPLTLKNCTFDSCGCIEEGYSIHVESSVSVSESVSLKVTDCTFTSCVGYDDGGFRCVELFFFLSGDGFLFFNIYYLFIHYSLVNQNAEIENCTFVDQQALGSGGAIYEVGGRISMEKCVIMGCYSSSGGGGGFIYSEGDEPLTVTECSFADVYTKEGDGMLYCNCEVK